MGKVIAGITTSLDGYVTGPNDRLGAGLGDGGEDRHADGPVRAGRDDPVDLERAREAVDRRLVLGREDAAPVGEVEAGRRGVAVDRGDPEPARPRCLEQPELCRSGP